MQELAMRLAETAGEQDKVALSLYNIGLIHYYQADDYDAAQTKINRAQAIYQRMDNRRGLVNCLFMSGSIANKKGRYRIAHKRYEEALIFCREIGWRHGETFILSSLGNNYFELGDYALCQTYQEKVQQICRELSDREGEAISLDTLGLAAHRLGDSATAQEHYQQALMMQQVIGDRHGEAYTLTHWGYTLAELGEWKAARSRFEGALALRRELGEEALAQDDLAGLAWVALAQNDLTPAVAGAEEILAWIEAEGVEGIEFPIQVYLICYRVLRAATSPSRAQAVLQQGYSLLQRRAAGIQDEGLRRRFLENVPFNREIGAAWASQP
jgi:tetratricopeptide (TPR) repeat protein